MDRLTDQSFNKTNAIEGVPNDLVFETNDDIMHSHDGHISTSGNEILDNAFDSFDSFDSPSFGGQASRLEFAADQSGGMDSATNNETPMDLSEYHDQTFAQASTEMGMDDVGPQASGFQPAAGHFEANTTMSSGTGNPADVQPWDFQVPDGHVDENGDMIDAFDLLRELSPGLRLTLATLGDSGETQVSKHGSF